MAYGQTNRPWMLKLLNNTFQIVDSANNVQFTSSTNNPQARGANLKLLDSGLLVLYDSAGYMLWASKGTIFMFLYKNKKWLSSKKKTVIIFF
jgi:hypothetical protein